MSKPGRLIPRFCDASGGERHVYPEESLRARCDLLTGDNEGHISEILCGYNDEQVELTVKVEKKVSMASHLVHQKRTSN